jgi:hypothetical protein
VFKSSSKRLLFTLMQVKSSASADFEAFVLSAAPRTETNQSGTAQVVNRGQFE